MALKENPEGLFDFPGYSKDSIRIQRLLEYISHLGDNEKNKFHMNKINIKLNYFN